MLIVGGEFVFSPGIIFNRNYHQFSDYGTTLTGYHRYYTFGAYYSFMVVIQNLNLVPGDYVLLPSYLCPTMIEPFKKAGVEYIFYKMKEGLQPDIEDIDLKSSPKLKAILFVDYFGFSQIKYLAEIVNRLRVHGVEIIQDTVQSWVNNEEALYGDYCMNSMRKIAPFEASVLFSKKIINFTSNNKSIGKSINHKRYAQLLRYFHMKYGLFSPHTFLKHLEISNQCYHQDSIIGMPLINKWLLDRIDFKTLGDQRRFVYSKIDVNLSPRHLLLSSLDDFVPLGLAVYLEDRNAKKDKLHSLNIHCPLHWKLPKEIDTKEYAFSWDIEQHALTIPTNVKLSQLQKYIDTLKDVL